MIEIFRRLFARIFQAVAALAARFARQRGSEPALSEAGSRDARAMAALHGASFHRGWSDGEFEQLLFDRNTVAHRAIVGGSLVGFILSRLVLEEAEILSVAVASSRRGKGLARRLLDLNLRRLAGLGARTVFLEVDEGNVPACRLYQRAGFRDVGRRPGRAHSAPRSGVTGVGGRHQSSGRPSWRPNPDDFP